MQERILIIDDKQSILEILTTTLENEKYECATCASGHDAMQAVQRERFDLVLCDVRLPDADGMEILRTIRARHADTTIIMITAYGSIENAIECMKLGADDYVTKPFNLDEIRAIVAKGLEKAQLRRENIALKKEVSRRYEFSNIIGKSKSLQDIFEKIRRVGPTDVSILITGETGTGKELVSKALHFNSDRRDKPFVALNCAAIPENLLESELFGHVKGSFTGAYTTKHGMFEEASGGTLLLDEIGDMHPSLQAKLLRTLDEGKIRRVGDTGLIPVDVRLVCSTNKNLAEEVRAVRFRLDLYHRIRVVEINLPPLRERREDIPLLAQHYLEKIGRDHNRQGMTIEPGAMRLIMHHNWIGNVRELINVIEQSVILSEGAVITETALGPLLGSVYAGPENYFDTDIPLKETMGKFEREVLRRALETNNGSRKETAFKLGISERTLYYKMEDYKLS
jgi:DNA-binding NtrC family response regulator